MFKRKFWVVLFRFEGTTDLQSFTCETEDIAYAEKSCEAAFDEKIDIVWAKQTDKVSEAIEEFKRECST